MIQSIEVSFFQSHKHTVLDFHSGVNIIRGRSHSGKSALWRAIDLAINNNPNKGLWFKSRKAEKKDEVSVGVEFDDGWILRRKNSGGVNLYECSEEEEPLSTIGYDLPSEIADITRMDSRNFREQGEGYFIMSDTPGAVGRRINAITGLDIVNEKQKRAKELVSLAKVVQKKIEEDLEEKKKELEKANKGLEWQKHVERIRVLMEKADRLEGVLSDLDERKERIEKCKEDIKVLEDWLTCEKVVQRIDYLWKKVQVLMHKERKLEGSRRSIYSLKAEISRFKKLIESESVISRIREINFAVSKSEAELRRVTDIYSAIRKLRESIAAANLTLSRLSEERTSILPLLDICPTCGAAKEHWKNEVWNHG